MDPLSMGMMAGGSLLSGIGGMINGNNLANANRAAGQQSAMLQAIAMQQATDRFANAQKGLQPYMAGGSRAMDMLLGYLQGGANGIGGGGNSLISTFSPTMAQLENTPGYKFILGQGTKAANNAAAARGLGSSGNALQGGIDYASNLASTTWKQQLDSYLAQNDAAFRMLMGPAGLGMNAANANMQGVTNFNNSMLGAASGVGSTMGNALVGGANAQANGINSLFGGMGNALFSMGGLNAYYNSPAFQNAGGTNYGLPQNVIGGLGRGLNAQGMPYAVPTY